MVAYIDNFVYNLRMRRNQCNPSARQRILATAQRLFYREGIRATGVDRLIAESGVTKATFYRHFPSKNDLIKAYLEDRHKLWMDWFARALEHHKKRVDSANADVLLFAVFREWFESEGYRGCAFINATVELAGVLPEVSAIIKRNKSEVVEVIAQLLPESEDRQISAQAIAVVLDGVILRAQMEMDADSALSALKTILPSLIKGGVPGSGISPERFPSRVSTA